MHAFRLAVDFKQRVYDLVNSHYAARQDVRYKEQLFDAASSVEANIAEGWARYVAGEMSVFLRYALGSLEEAKRRVRDGIDRGYYTKETCQELLNVGDRCGAATMALWKSLQPFKKGPGRPPPRPPRKHP
jgi:four helix bundle protein